MNWLKLKIIWILLGGLLFLLTNNGQAFVSPQHYEKLKMQNKQRTKEGEKVQPRVLVKIQVDRPSQSQPQNGKAGPK